MVTLDIAAGIAHIRIDEPPLNVLTRAVLADLRGALDRAEADSTTRVLLLTAAGKHFSAGASVEEHLPPQCDEMIPEFMTTVLALRECPLPTIAAVQGRCLGGAFELVQAADIVIAASNAHFGQPEILLGVFAPAACVLLPERIGPARAAELLFTGDPIDAERAQAAGFISRIVGVDELEAAALATAERIARHSAAALRSMKQAMLACRTHDTRQALAVASSCYLDELMQTHDALEGLQAFTAKRTPLWSHA